MSDVTALDHVGIAGPELDAMAAAFERLGFVLTPLAHHAGGRTGNRCIMLRQGYVELLGKMPGGSSATLDRFLARYAGIHIIALAIADETATLARLHRAAVEPATLSKSDRAVDEDDPSGPRAHFSLVTTPDLPEGRINLLRHHTPHALWQDRFVYHPNHAVALAEVVLMVAHPEETAARLCRLAGHPITADVAGGYAISLPHGRLRILLPDAAASVFPGMQLPALPWIGGITIQTNDVNEAVERVLQDRNVPYQVVADAILVEAAGAVLRFVGGHTLE